MKNTKAKYRFIFARKGLNNSGKALIQIEVAFNRQLRKLLSTGIYVNVEQWDKKKNQINTKHPNAIRLNNLINTQIYGLEEMELELTKKNKPFTPQHLKNFIQDIGADFFTLASSSIESDGKLGDKARPRVLAHIKKFNEICGPVSVDELNFLHIKKFDKWLKDKSYHTNTIASYHKDVKRSINALIREDEMDKNPYFKFKITKVRTRREYLTAAEVKKLAALSYPDGKQLTLDRFLISCGTALRFSDCYVLHSSQIYQGEADKGLVVDLERMKKVEHPVKNLAYEYFNGIADERLRKYLGTDGYLFYTGRGSIDAQNTIDNANLKIIAIDAGINKAISFHASRHTALTEVATRTGNVFSVMKFGGIRKVDTAMIYIHLASEKF